jgi:hypothetical protein
MDRGWSMPFGQRIFPPEDLVAILTDIHTAQQAARLHFPQSFTYGTFNLHGAPFALIHYNFLAKGWVGFMLF